jgi:hypothetical protein
MGVRVECGEAPSGLPDLQIKCRERRGRERERERERVRLLKREGERVGEREVGRGSRYL